MNTNNPAIQSVKVNKVRHLRNLEISIGESSSPCHLIFTGKNGSGKTSLLKSMWQHICSIAVDVNFNHLSNIRHLSFFQEHLKKAETENNQVEVVKSQHQIDILRQKIEQLSGEVEITLSNKELFPALIADRKFLLAYYSDHRFSTFKAPKNPEKPNLSFKLTDNKVDQFLNFLVDLKVQRALAAEEGKKEVVEDINKWFGSFVDILRRIFRDNALVLEFDYKNYAFTICTQMGSFPFTGLSAGYSAVLDIVADMMLKMQPKDTIVRTFEMPGIVFIDEIETHLHLELQKEILHILTSIFPNVQFVITTHSPFVVSAVQNSLIYDLENKESITNLTEYSYGSLMEGFFGVDSDSAELKRRINMFESLIKKTDKTIDDKQEIIRLRSELLALPEWTAPALKARFNELNLKNSLETLS